MIPCHTAAIHSYVPPVCHRQHVKDEKKDMKCTGIRHFGNTIRITNDTRVCTLTRNWLNEKSITPPTYYNVSVKN